MEVYQRKHRHIFPYVPHCRIPEDEVCQVYGGFEIASHSVDHKNLTKLTQDEARENIARDVEQLSQKFSRQVTGFAYPFGASNESVKQVLRGCGIRYARTGGSVQDFRFPEDPLELPISCWHISSKAMDKLDGFLNAPEQEEDMLFLMFAHGYEFDFGVKESSWEKFRRICDRVASHDEIICCSTADALAAHNM